MAETLDRSDGIAPLEGATTVVEIGGESREESPAPKPPKPRAPDPVQQHLQRVRVATIHRLRAIVRLLADGEAPPADALVAFARLGVSDTEVGDLVQAQIRDDVLSGQVAENERALPERQRVRAELTEKIEELRATIREAEAEVKKTIREREHCGRLPYRNPERLRIVHRSKHGLLFSSLPDLGPADPVTTKKSSTRKRSA